MLKKGKPFGAMQTCAIAVDFEKEMLPNERLLAKIGFDRAENEPLEF